MWPSLETATLIHDVANVVLFIAASVTAVATITVFWTANIKEEHLKKEVSGAKTRGEEAKAHAAQANERAAQAEARAAEANLELARFKAPRSLTKAQQNILRDRLKQFAGMSIDILRFGETTEIVHLSDLLAEPLSQAGWSQRSWNVTGAGAVTGVLISVQKGSGENIQSAAANLLAALREVGVASDPFEYPGEWQKAPGMVMGPPWDSAKIAPIKMLIGSKP